MSTAPTVRVVPPGEGKCVLLFAVRFDYKVTSTDSGGALAALEVAIPPGTLVKPRGIPHAMWNTGPEPARVLEVLSPGGLEDYFEELAPALRAKVPPAEYDALAARYGLTIQNDWIEELEQTHGVKL